MGNLDSYIIDLMSRDLAGKTFEIDIDDAFFAGIDGLIKRGKVHTIIECVNVSTVYKFRIHSVGVVVVPCDRCLSDLELRIDTEDVLTVKLGDDYDDDGDCVTVPESEGRIDLTQIIYEFIALSMPITCQHEPGKCDDAMMQQLSLHQAARSGQEDDENDDSADSGIDEGPEDGNDGPVDERWAALAKLKH